MSVSVSPCHLSGSGRTALASSSTLVDLDRQLALAGGHHRAVHADPVAEVELLDVGERRRRRHGLRDEQLDVAGRGRGSWRRSTCRCRAAASCARRRATSVVGLGARLEAAPRATANSASVCDAVEPVRVRLGARARAARRAWPGAAPARRASPLPARCRRGRRRRSASSVAVVIVPRWQHGSESLRRRGVSGPGGRCRADAVDSLRSCAVRRLTAPSSPRRGPASRCRPSPQSRPFRRSRPAATADRAERCDCGHRVIDIVTVNNSGERRRRRTRPPRWPPPAMRAPPRRSVDRRASA